jgi:hypothetical protein
MIVRNYISGINVILYEINIQIIYYMTENTTTYILNTQDYQVDNSVLFCIYKKL